MITLLLIAIVVLLLLCTVLAWVLVICDRALKSRAVRLHHQAERIRSYRAELADKAAENKLLGEACDALAAQVPTAPPEPPLPRWGYRVLHQIHNATPADFDNRKDNR
ncbi:hypothetical protein ABZ777_32395 [Micromonospora parva]|uniref:hypothetical protein n=1 Tax=Micromonospora parva TaxID=1464048 RepID=UPI0033F069A3